MNLYAFVHNDPLTHFDEYGLLDMGQFSISPENQYQATLGGNYGIVNGVFNTLSWGNTLMHAPLAPFSSFNRNTYKFNWSMPLSYHTANNWLDQKHSLINDRFFSKADYTNPFFQQSKMGSEFMTDQFLGGVPGKVIGIFLRGGAWTYNKIRNIGSHFPEVQKKIQGNHFLNFFSKDSKQISYKLTDLEPTLERINKGTKFPHRNDGTFFQNREGLLPKNHKEYYREYVHPTPGSSGPGPKRIIVGENGEIYYTPDHYRTFVKVK